MRYEPIKASPCPCGHACWHSVKTLADSLGPKGSPKRSHWILCCRHASGATIGHASHATWVNLLPCFVRKHPDSQVRTVPIRCVGLGLSVWRNSNFRLGKPLKSSSRLACERKCYQKALRIWPASIKSPLPLPWVSKVNDEFGR